MVFGLSPAGSAGVEDFALFIRRTVPPYKLTD